MDLTIGGHLIPFRPLYVLIASYTGFINVFLCVICLIISVSLNSKRETDANEVKASMTMPLFWLSTVLAFLFVSCLVFSVIDSHFHLIDYSDWEQTEKSISPFSIIINLVSAITVFLIIRRIKPKLSAHNKENDSAGKYVIGAFLAIVVIIPLIIAFFSRRLSWDYYNKIFLYYLGLSFVLFLSSFALTYSKKVSILRWMCLFIVLSCFNYIFFQPLCSLLFTPQMKEYCHQIERIVEEEKEKTGKYPPEIDRNNHRIKSIVNKTKNIGFCFFYSSYEEKYSIEFMDNAMNIHYCYSIKEKKWHIFVSFLWR